MPLWSRHPAFALPAAVCLLLALSSPAAATSAARKRVSQPDAAGESQSGPEFTVKVPVNVVLVNVTVTDKAGRPVKDLTAADFKLFEDGKRQRIQSFEIESSRPAVSPEPEDPARTAGNGDTRPAAFAKLGGRARQTHQFFYRRPDRALA